MTIPNVDLGCNKETTEKVEEVSIKKLGALDNPTDKSELWRKAIAGSLSKEEKEELPSFRYRVVQGQAVISALLSEIHYPPKEFAFVSALVSMSDGKSEVEITHHEIGKLMMGKASDNIQKKSIESKSYRSMKKSLEWQVKNGWRLFDVKTGGMEYKRVEDAISENGKRRKIVTFEQVPHGNIYKLHILDVAAALLEKALSHLSHREKAGTRTIEQCAYIFAHQFLKATVSVTSQIKRAKLTEEAKFHRKMRSLVTSLQNSLRPRDKEDREVWARYLKEELDWITSGKLDEELGLLSRGESMEHDPSHPKPVKPIFFDPTADLYEGVEDE